jgi:hypothetical protein
VKQPAEGNGLGTVGGVATQDLPVLLEGLQNVFVSRQNRIRAGYTLLGCINLVDVVPGRVIVAVTPHIVGPAGRQHKQVLVAVIV